MNYALRLRLTYALALAPAVLFLSLQVVPIAYAVREALVVDGRISSANVVRVFSDPLFGRAVLYNAVIPLVSVALEACVGLAMALWFYYLRRGKALWRTVAVVPFALPEIVYLLTMKLVFREHGYLNSILAAFGAHPVGWLSPGTPLAFFVVVAVDAWRVTPIVFLIVLSALEQIPRDYIDAAEVDGASRLQVIWHIQIPLVLPALLVSLALRAVDAFRIFATPLVLLGVQGMPVLTSVAYYYKVDANDAAAANVAALVLAAALLTATAVTAIALGRRRR